MLPQLSTARDFGSLMCACTGLRKMVCDAPLPVWHAVAASLVGPLHPASTRAAAASEVHEACRKQMLARQRLRGRQWSYTRLPPILSHPGFSPDGASIALLLWRGADATLKEGGCQPIILTSPASSVSAVLEIISSGKKACKWTRDGSKVVRMSATVVKAFNAHSSDCLLARHPQRLCRLGFRLIDGAISCQGQRYATVWVKRSWRIVDVQKTFGNELVCFSILEHSRPFIGPTAAINARVHYSFLWHPHNDDIFAVLNLQFRRAAPWSIVITILDLAAKAPHQLFQSPGFDRDSDVRLLSWAPGPGLIAYTVSDSFIGPPARLEVMSTVTGGIRLQVDVSSHASAVHPLGAELSVTGLLAVHAEGYLQVWNADAGARMFRIRVAADTNMRLNWSPSGKLFAFWFHGSPGVVIMRAGTWNVLALIGTFGAITDVIWSPTSTALACCYLPGEHDDEGSQNDGDEPERYLQARLAIIDFLA